jgi:SPASM domain peptide maturase of grasp-with-spasm system
MPESVFKLYANCVPVRGARRSLLCDLQRNQAHFIPNGLFAILTEMAGRSSAEIKREFNGQCDQIVDEYFEFLLGHDYGFLCDEPERFPDLHLAWDHPGAVTNAILDIDCDSRHDYERLFSQFDDLGCEAVQIRAFDVLSLEEVRAIVETSAGCRLRHLELFLKYQSALTEDVLEDLCREYQWISHILVHTSPFALAKRVAPLSTFLTYHKSALELSACGQVDMAYFALNLTHFTEALHFNTCLNRKISICADGEIRNCPSMPGSLGNVRDTSLCAAARNPSLVQIGRITKDQIAVCRDCEFRYICTDCRAHIENPDDLYSKPAKCGYDPYTATWAGAEAQ